MGQLGHSVGCRGFENQRTNHRITGTLNRRLIWQNPSIIDGFPGGFAIKYGDFTFPGLFTKEYLIFRNHPRPFIVPFPGRCYLGNSSPFRQ